MKIEKIKKIISYIESNFYVSILFIAPIISLLWHLENNQLPFSDAIGYLDSASIIYQNLVEGNYFDFIISIFNERSWRPVIFQLFIFPFLLVSDGNLLTAVMLTHFLFVSLSVFIIYKIFLVTGSKLSASLSSSIICLSIDILFGGTSYPLFSEISFIPFLLGTLYLLSDRKLFRNKKKSYYFILFFTLTMLSRPVEGALFLLFPLIFIIMSQHKGYLNTREIIKGFMWPISFLWLLFASRLYPNISSSILKIDPPNSYEIFFTIFCFTTIVFCIFIIYFIYKKFSKINRENNNLEKVYFSKSIFLSSLILWIWYTPRFGSLYGWVYDTSIGDQFQYQKDFEYNFIQLLTNAIDSRGSLILYGVLILFFISLLLPIKKMLVKNIEIIKNIKSLFFASALLPTIIYFTTHQVTYRKIAPVVTMILIFMIIYIIKSNKFKKFTNILLTMILTSQIYFFYENIYGVNNNELWQNYGKTKYSSSIIGSSFPRPVNVVNNSYKKLIRFLKIESNKANIKNIALVLTDNSFPVEPYLLKFLCDRSSISCNVSSPKKFEYGGIDYLSDNDGILIIHNFDLAGVNSLENEILAKKQIENSINNSSPYELYSYYFTYLYIAKKLNIHNMSTLRCKNIYKEYKACLLIKD